MNPISKDFKAAYGDFWNVIGVLISGVSIFNFLARTFQIDPSPLLQRLLDAYRSIFHPLIDFFFGWVPIHLTPELKDGVSLYFVIGGAVARTYLTLTRAVGKQAVHADGDRFMRWFVVSPFTRLIGLVVCLLLWPLMLIVFWMRPIVVNFSGEQLKDTRSNVRNWRRRFLRRRLASERNSAISLGTYEHDLRRVFFLQLLAALSVVLVMALETAAAGS